MSDFSTIECLAENYKDFEAYFYPNPLGEGWVCALAIRDAGIRREAIGSTKAAAALAAATAVAKELGMKEEQ